MIQTSTAHTTNRVVCRPVSDSKLRMNYVLFCQPVLTPKEVETIANGGDKGGLRGGCCRKVCRMGGFEDGSMQAVY
jgi:hypothetical protein